MQLTSFSFDVLATIESDEGPGLFLLYVGEYFCKLLIFYVSSAPLGMALKFMILTKMHLCGFLVPNSTNTSRKSLYSHSETNSITWWVKSKWNSWKFYFWFSYHHYFLR